jgi:hypothetical protein
VLWEVPGSKPSGLLYGSCKFSPALGLHVSGPIYDENRRSYHTVKNTVSWCNIVLYCTIHFGTLSPKIGDRTDGAVVQDTSVQGDVREIWETRTDGGGNKILYRTAMFLYPYCLVLYDSET